MSPLTLEGAANSRPNQFATLKGSPDDWRLNGPFPVDDQRRLGEPLMKAIGFDFNQGASM